MSRCSSRADRRRVGQVVGNLLSNALKYSPDGGSVSVTAARDDGRLLVSVADEGIGIPEESRHDVFMPFFRVDQEANPGGTGLGLAISRRIVRQHGGEMDFVSLPGKGSTFYLRPSRSSLTRSRMSGGASPARAGSPRAPGAELLDDQEVLVGLDDPLGRFRMAVLDQEVGRDAPKRLVDSGRRPAPVSAPRLSALADRPRTRARRGPGAPRGGR